MQFQVIGFDRVFFDPTHRLAQQPRMKTETLSKKFFFFFSTESRFSYGVVELTGGLGQKKRGRTLKVP